MFAQILERFGFGLEARGGVQVKGKGLMETWWVTHARGAAPAPSTPAPAPPHHHPRSLAAIVYTMMRKRMNTHPLDSVDRRTLNRLTGLPVTIYHKFYL